MVRIEDPDIFPAVVKLDQVIKRPAVRGFVFLYFSASVDAYGVPFPAFPGSVSVLS